MALSDEDLAKIQELLQPKWADMKAAYHNLGQRLDGMDETLKALVHESAKSKARLDRVELESLRYDVDAIKTQLGIE